MNDRLQVGDIVTRDGTDRHVVVDVSDDNYVGTFLCIRAPDMQWIAQGEQEYNLCRRYQLVERCAAETGDPGGQPEPEPKR